MKIKWWRSTRWWTAGWRTTRWRTPNDNQQNEGQEDEDKDEQQNNMNNIWQYTTTWALVKDMFRTYKKPDCCNT